MAGYKISGTLDAACAFVLQLLKPKLVASMMEPFQQSHAQRSNATVQTDRSIFVHVPAYGHMTTGTRTLLLRSAHAVEQLKCRMQ